MANPYKFLLTSIFVLVGVWVGVTIAIKQHPQETVSVPAAVHPLPKAVASPNPRPIVSPSVVAQSPSSPPQVVSERITKEGYLAALTEEELEEAIGYQAQNNDEALRKMLESRRVIDLKPGVRVRV